MTKYFLIYDCLLHSFIFSSFDYKNIVLCYRARVLRRTELQSSSTVHLNYVGTFSCYNQLRANDFQKIEKSIKVFLNEKDLSSCWIIQRAYGAEAPGPSLIRLALCLQEKNEVICAVIQSGNIYISFQTLRIFICNFITVLHHQS